MDKSQTLTYWRFIQFLIVSGDSTEAETYAQCRDNITVVNTTGMDVTTHSISHVFWDYYRIWDIFSVLRLISHITTKITYLQSQHMAWARINYMVKSPMAAVLQPGEICQTLLIKMKWLHRYLNPPSWAPKASQSDMSLKAHNVAETRWPEKTSLMSICALMISPICAIVSVRRNHIVTIVYICEHVEL